MTVRKMITFPDRGAELLLEATDGARERAAGEYLSAVLIQRHRAWTRALDTLRLAYQAERLLELVLFFAARSSSVGEIEIWLMKHGKSETEADVTGPMLHILAIEYEAGNKSLMKALHQESKS